MYGKKKCRMLREIRRRIANENEIPFVTEECRFKGECRGTCPKCEAELRYLEEQLERRRSLGLRVSVAALAVGFAAGLGGCGGRTLAGAPEPLEGDVAIEESTSDPGEQLDGEIAPSEDGDETETVPLVGDVDYVPDGAGAERNV